MHSLDRSAVPAPACLARYRHGTHQWDMDHPTREHRAEIWQALNAMQERLCAYCEGSLDKLGQHIEHFRTRNSAPQLTYAWTNLLGSCDQTDCCGHYKDNRAGPYNANELIDPTQEDPDHFFRFLENGTITLRAGLSPSEQRRGWETIRVLGLDAGFGRLREMRRQAAMTYQGPEPDIHAALLDFSPDERREYVRLELKRTATDPYCTVIRHFLEGLD